MGMGLPKLNTAPPSAEWEVEARRRGFTLGRGPLRNRPLKKKLLVMGGWASCIPELEPDLGKIMTRGLLFVGKVKIRRGLPSSCHRNCAALWSLDPSAGEICTGYALSADGMWRQHSWMLQKDGSLVETTVRRVGYFGFVMSPSESLDFSASNW